MRMMISECVVSLSLFVNFCKADMDRIVVCLQLVYLPGPEPTKLIAVVLYIYLGPDQPPIARTRRSKPENLDHHGGGLRSRTTWSGRSSSASTT
jgi:hypothetical protein